MYCIVCDVDIGNERLENHINRKHPLDCSICDLRVAGDMDMASYLETYHAEANNE